MNSWSARIDQGVRAEHAAAGTLVPGVISVRYPARRAANAITYDVEIGARGGRQHTLYGLTGAAYCQPGQPVWVAMPYGDPHRGAYVLGRQQPGIPRVYGVVGRSATLKFLGHWQAYWVTIRAEITYASTARRWTEPIADVTPSLDVTVAGNTSSLAMDTSHAHLAGTRRPDVAYRIVGEATELTTSAADPGHHSHQIETHDHPAAQSVQLPGGFVGPYTAVVDIADAVAFADYALRLTDETYTLPAPTTEEITLDAVVIARVDGDACTVAVQQLHVAEIGVWTG